MITWVGYSLCGLAKKFVLYCSDVAGAFDRVRVKRLLDKLEAKGVADRWRKLFDSWLRERPAVVVVGGKHSGELTLKNMVSQGTVWGPAF